MVNQLMKLAIHNKMFVINRFITFIIQFKVSFSRKDLYSVYYEYTLLIMIY